MFRIFLILGVFLLVPLSRLAAQEATEIIPGMKVRISAPDVAREKITGDVVSFDSETLVVKARGRAKPWTIPVAGVNRLEVSRGRKTTGTRVLKGAGIGTLAGAEAGFVAGVIYWQANKVDHVDDLSGLAMIFFPAIGAPAGLLIGTIIGATPGEQWETVPLSRFRVSVVPYRHGGGVSVSYQI